MSRLPDLLEMLRGYSSRTCLEGDGFSYRYSDLCAELDRWSCKLDDLPAEAGHVIGLRADYSMSAIGAFLALLARGFIPALVPRDRSISDYLVHCRASALLEIELHGTHRYSAVSPPAPTPPTHPLLQQLHSSRESGFIVFTSGSTGMPKAALHSVDRFLLKFDRIGRSLRTLAFLLFDHIAGVDTLFYTLRNGGTLILTYRRDPRAILQLVTSQRIEVLPTSPSFLRLLCAEKDSSHMELPTLKVITYGSEPMDPTTLQRVNERFPGVRIVQKYGTTELGSPQTISRSNDSLWLKFRCDRSQIKVVNGILWLRTRGTMLGYINVPSPTIEDGWLCTGDLVEVDGEWLRILGRADEVIKVGGEKVSPREVEGVIRELDSVKAAFVSGESHPLMGQVLTAKVAVVSERPRFTEVAASIRRHCQERLGPHHVPVRITLVREDSLDVLSYRFKQRRSTIGHDNGCEPGQLVPESNIETLNPSNTALLPYKSATDEAQST